MPCVKRGNTQECQVLGAPPELTKGLNPEPRLPIRAWMGSSARTRNLMAFFVAATVTAGSYLIDGQRAEVLESRTALRWARQITSQIESVSLTARTRGEEDPLGWAVDYLTQGVEPRMVRIARLSSEFVDGIKDGESWRLDRVAGTFGYTRVLDPTTATAIRVDLDLGYSGFAGSKLRLTNDLALAGLFATIFALFNLQLALRAAKRLIRELQDKLAQALAAQSEPILAPATPAEPMISAAEVTSWISQSKAATAAIARSVRDLLKQAQAVVSAAKSSEAAASQIREKIHSGLSDLHGSRLALRQATVWMGQLEKLAQAPSTDENRRKLQIALKRVREVCQRNEKMLQELELRIEPLATDADVALEQNRNVLSATKGMGEKIEGAKKSLLAQSRLQQRFNSSQAAPGVEPAAEAPAASEEPVARFYPKDKIPDRPVRKRPRKTAAA